MPRRLVQIVRGPKDTVKIYRDTEWNEFQVVPQSRPTAETTYHTNDAQDAKDTAALMAGRLDHLMKPLVSTGAVIPKFESNPLLSL